LGKFQIFTLAGAIVIVLLLFFGFEYKPNKIINLEKSRSNNLEVTGIENLIVTARESLSLEEMKTLEAMQAATKDSAVVSKIESTKAYASKWYELGYPVISAYYAEEVAKVDKSADSWAIAGTSYILGLKSSEQEKEKEFAFNRAITAFENAISLEPENVNHQINLSLVYVEKPLSDNPMKGILMLRDLNKKYPENASVMVQLARLAIKTGQWDRAQERLEQALKIDGNNRQANCLMAEVMTNKGESDLAKPFIDICNAE
jgi:tetratricopeptide (TPR) repeat protein